jgi:hypothetical protein
MTRHTRVAVASAVLATILLFADAASAASARRELSDNQLDVVAAGAADAKAVGDGAAEGALVQSGSLVRAYTRADTTAAAIATGQVTAAALGSDGNLGSATSNLSLAVSLS